MWLNEIGVDNSDVISNQYGMKWGTGDVIGKNL